MKPTWYQHSTQINKNMESKQLFRERERGIYSSSIQKHTRTHSYTHAYWFLSCLSFYIVQSEKKMVSVSRKVAGRGQVHLQGKCRWKRETNWQRKWRVRNWRISLGFSVKEGKYRENDYFFFAFIFRTSLPSPRPLDSQTRGINGRHG